MITAKGYSKDPNIVPEGIAVTMGKDMIQEQGGLKTFLKNFEEVMNDENSWWNHKCKNRPQYDVAYVYIIIYNRVLYRVQLMDYSKEPDWGVTADGREVQFDWPRIRLTGPLVKAPEKIVRKGFQGFRYTTKLF